MAAKCAFNADYLEEALRDRIVGMVVKRFRVACLRITEEGLDLKRTSW